MASAWITADSDLLSIPARPGCYVIFSDGKVIYVGQSYSLNSRVRSYRFMRDFEDGWISDFGNHQTLTIKYRLSRKFGDWAMVELRLIKRLKPERNKIGVTKRVPHNG